MHAILNSKLYARFPLIASKFSNINQFRHEMRVTYGVDDSTVGNWVLQV